MPKSAPLPINPNILKKLREICLELPEATETMSWGKPHFHVAQKIFCGVREEDGRTVIGLLLEMGHAQMLEEDPRFYLVGSKGGVCMDVSNVKDWQEVKALVKESYFLMAPKNLAQQVVGTSKSTGGTKTKQVAGTSKSTGGTKTKQVAGTSKATGGTKTKQVAGTTKAAGKTKPTVKQR